MMVQRHRKVPSKAESHAVGIEEQAKALSGNATAIDPTLALLFASSAGPMKTPQKFRYRRRNLQKTPSHVTEPPILVNRDNAVDEMVEQDDEDLGSADEDIEKASHSDKDRGLEGVSRTSEIDKLVEATDFDLERKRKRKIEDVDIESRYMQKLAEEEEAEEGKRQAQRHSKKQKFIVQQAAIHRTADSEDIDEEDEVSDIVAEDENVPADPRLLPLKIPLHESLAPSKSDVELEKASRTVFLANVSSTAITEKSAKKILTTYLGSFLTDLPPPPAGKPPHKVESIRFRSTAYAGTSLPKKAAFAKKELMPATTKSTNAYAVYSTAFAAREAVKRLNGTIVLDRHLRVDGVAHPMKTDHRRCVFVGNLGFVDDESMLDQGGENERKRAKIPSDIEEGLWRQFNKAGIVESVRVVRDEKTRVGKGFAYVQFLDPNSVEAALLFNDKKYPPMLPRILRVVRAKAVRKTALAVSAARAGIKKSQEGSKVQVYNPKISAEAASFRGRAGKLLGKAGAAHLKEKVGVMNTSTINKRGLADRKRNGMAFSDTVKPPESFVFEGFRASANSGKPRDLKFSGKKAAKPKPRSTKRASEWKKGNGKKDR